MFHVATITALDQPELAPYRTLKRSAAHAQLGIFVVEGDKVLDRLLESDFTVVSVLITEERFPEYQARLHARPEPDIAVFVCAKPVLEGMVGFEIYQGVLAIAKTPPPLTLEKILATGPRPRLLVAMDGLSNAENVGTLMRNCVAFGVTALIAGETCCNPYLRRTVRNSMGAIFKLPVLEVGKADFARWGERPREPLQTSANGSPGVSPHLSSLVETLRELHAHGIHTIAAHPHTDKKVLSQADFTGDCCVVFGSEGHGISKEVLAACDEAVAVPMANGVDSLNVSMAAAVFLYEANRQRKKA
jgi:tRNA G18 (ribose-2'-O)-methylase SpoU